MSDNLQQAISEQRTYRIISLLAAVVVCFVAFTGMRCTIHKQQSTQKLYERCLEKGVEPIACRAGVDGV